MTPEKRREILQELWNRLDGECSLHRSTCPHGFSRYAWHCEDCDALLNEIGFFSGNGVICPCAWTMRGHGSFEDIARIILREIDK